MHHLLYVVRDWHRCVSSSSSDAVCSGPGKAGLECVGHTMKVSYYKWQTEKEVCMTVALMLRVSRRHVPIERWMGPRAHSKRGLF